VDLPSGLDLSGRVAIVTGAGSPEGIGFAACRQLGELGASLVVAATTSRAQDRAAELADHGIDAVAVVADLTVAASAQALVDAAISRWDRVDILVNNAGMTSTSDPDFQSGAIGTMSYDTWRASVTRNLDTAFLASTAVLPVMKQQGWGRIVMVSSVTGPVMATRDDVGYAASKAGMVGLCRAMALDMATSGITVNSVAPGWIATASQTDDERGEGLATPVGRSGTPDEVATAIAWLCTPGASYITGQNIVIDGGNSVSEARAISN
jgi:3-oxoacyl-[acyl-carrier protein] reductase